MVIKYITDPEYSHILKLLQSSCIDDVRLGAEFLDKSDFTDKELKWALPGAIVNDHRRDIRSGLIRDNIEIPIRTELSLGITTAWISISNRYE